MSNLGGVTLVLPLQKKRNKLYLMSIFLMMLIGAHPITSMQVAAIPEYSKDLPPSLKNFCNVCHTKPSGGPLNDFGEDYARFGHEMGPVAGLDSDDDGYTNAEELSAGTLPGTPTSYPSTRKKGMNTTLILGLAGLVLLAVLVYRLRGGQV